jgi:hypothetical protein
MHNILWCTFFRICLPKKNYTMKTLILILIFAQQLFAQAQSKNQYLTFGAGLSLFGTGDLTGHNLSFGYHKQQSKLLFFETNLRAGTASKVTYFQNNDPYSFNNQFRKSTSNLQLEALGGIPLVNKQIRLALLAGLLLSRDHNNSPNIIGIENTQTLSALRLRYDKNPITHNIGQTIQLEAAIKLNPNSYLAARLAGQFYSGNTNWHIPIVYQHKL